MLLDKASAKPLYVQMEELFWGKLDSGEWSPGALIPSENELSHMYGISRTTVRNVITKLVQEEVLFRIPGKGTYVAEPKIVAQSLSYAGIREQLEKMGSCLSRKRRWTKRPLPNFPGSKVLSFLWSAGCGISKRLLLACTLPIFPPNCARIWGVMTSPQSRCAPS